MVMAQQRRPQQMTEESMSWARRPLSQHFVQSALPEPSEHARATEREDSWYHNAQPLQQLCGLDCHPAVPYARPRML